MKKRRILIGIVSLGVLFCILFGWNAKKEYRVVTYYDREIENGYIKSETVGVMEELNEQLIKEDLHRHIVFQNTKYTYLKLTEKQREALGNLPIFRQYDLPPIRQYTYDPNDFGQMDSGFVEFE